MKQVTRVRPDLEQSYSQAHALVETTGAIERRKLTRHKLRQLFEELGPSFFGMEACGFADYWARELSKKEHDVRLVTAIYVKPYVKGGKNNAADAAAICEAMFRDRGCALCNDPVDFFSGNMTLGEIVEHCDGRRDQAVDGPAQERAGFGDYAGEHDCFRGFPAVQPCSLGD